jgi:membrane fusion protein (multidrug efflux system)
MVPQRAVQQGREGRFVYVVERGEQGEVAARRPVEMGPWVGANWLVESGLAVGDRVIVNGIQKVQPGAPVTVAAAGANANGPGANGPGTNTAPAASEAPEGPASAGATQPETAEAGSEQ